MMFDSRLDDHLSDSSDEYVTDSDDSQVDDGPREIYDVDQKEDTNGPRKVIKARRYLLKLILGAITVKQSTTLDPGPLALTSKKKRNDRVGADKESRAPWEHVGEWVQNLGGTLSDSRVLDIPQIKSGLAVFDHLATTVLVPLTVDKKYIRDILTKSEAKAVQPFLRQLDKLRATSGYPASSTALDLHLIDCTPPLVLSRLALLSLSPPITGRPRTFDLSHLGFIDTHHVLSSLNLPSTLEIMGLNADDITHLSLAHNRLTIFPHWTPFPFRNLTSLDLSGNHELRYLPTRLAALPKLVDVNSRNTQLVTQSMNGVGTAEFLAAQCTIGLFGEVEGKHVDRKLLMHAQGGFRESRASSVDRPKQDSMSPPLYFSRGVKSLVHIAAAKLLQSHHALLSDVTAIADYGLPPHLAEKLHKGYACEICDSTQMPGQKAWMETEIETGWAVHAAKGENGRIMRDGHAGKEVRIRGRVCAVCYGRLIATQRTKFR